MGVRKGCYNCSKRRIVCDETEPRCLKCVKKGLECSGVKGLRIRFNDGVASRGKLRGLSIPVPPEDRCHTTEADAQQHSTPGRDIPSPGYLGAFPNSSQVNLLLNHFSTSIGAYMVVLDGPHNGYRNLLLPLAVRDQLVQKAVCSIAAFHLSRHSHPELRESAEQARTEVIQQMKNASVTSSAVLCAPTWATLLVLLIGELILGGNHYVYLLRMMCSIKMAWPCETDNELVTFLHDQTDLLIFLALPFLEDANGIPTVSDACLEIVWQDNPARDVAQQETIHLVCEATRLCFQIYQDRARGDTTNRWSTLQQVKDLVVGIHPGVAGGHSLVWAYFIAAADSDPEDELRAFFIGRLVEIYDATDCANISEGLKMLEQLQVRPTGQPWPQLLPIISTTFVM